MICSVRLSLFYSQADEDRFFEALAKFPAVRSVRGVGLDLIIDLDPRKLGRESLLDLNALLHRYGIGLRPLGELAERRRFAWLRTRTKYWYRSMFRGTAA